jgi:hypothetical protein
MISVLPTALSRQKRYLRATAHLPEDESHEARAARSLAHLEDRLEFRRRVRLVARVLGLVGIPLLLSALVLRQVRLASY